MRSFRRHWLWLALLIPLSLHCNGDAVSRALKALEKGKYQQVEKLISKSLDKHPLNPGAYFVWSKLYLDPSFTRYNLDSAHYFIELALAQTNIPDSVESWPLEKSSLVNQQLQHQKASIDSLAFSRAREVNSVAGYQHFIDLYQNSEQFLGAISARNQLAFNEAEAANTHQSYQQFIQTYPQAEQIPIATERYHRLLFESMTSGGRLQDYIHFWNENPRSPYRGRAEEQILQLSCLSHQSSAYQQFVQEYPKSSYTHQARAVLYHLDKTKVTSAGWKTDSLLTAFSMESKPLATTLENGRLGFMDVNGIIQIEPSFDSIPEYLHCSLLTDDFVPVKSREKWQLIARNGSTLWDEPFDDYQDLGSGYIKIRRGDLWGVIHKGNWSVLPQQYQDIRLLDIGLIAFKKNGLWGIASMLGRELLPPEHQEIIEEGPFLLLQRKKWAVLNQPKLINDYLRKQSPDYRFKDWEILSYDHIMVFGDGQEGVLDRNLNYKVPFSSHRIYEVDSASWWTKTAHGTLRFYGEALRSIPPDRYQDIITTDRYVGLNRSGQWRVMDWSLRPVDEVNYDSVAVLGKHFLLLFSKEHSDKVLFPGEKMVNIKNGQALKLVRGANQKIGFLQVSSSGGLREVYNWRGDYIYRTWYFEVQPLNAELMIIEQNGKQGVIDINGKQLLKARYNTITADEQRGLNLWDRKKFGYFHIASGQVIKPQYDNRLQALNQLYFMAEKDGKKGLVDLKNRSIIPFKYQEIQIWSDSVALVREDREYALYDFINEKFVYQQIKGWDWVTMGDHKSAIVRLNGGYGLLDNREGLVIEPIHRDIINIGTDEQPLLVTESRSSDTSTYQLTYYDQFFRIFKKLDITAEEHAKLWCF